MQLGAVVMVKFTCIFGVAACCIKKNHYPPTILLHHISIVFLCEWGVGQPVPLVPAKTEHGEDTHGPALSSTGPTGDPASGSQTGEAEEPSCGKGTGAALPAIDGTGSGGENVRPGGDGFRNQDTMTTLPQGGTQERLGDDTELDVPLRDLLNQCSAPRDNDETIFDLISLWFHRRDTLGDVALLDPPMEVFADRIASTIQYQMDRAELRRKLQQSHEEAEKKLDAAANIMVERHRLKLKKHGNLPESSDVFQGQVKKVKEWKENKLSALELEVKAFDIETVKVVVPLSSIYEEVVDKVCEMNAAETPEVDPSIMAELEELLNESPEDIPKAWYPYTVTC